MFVFLSLVLIYASVTASTHVNSREKARYYYFEGAREASMGNDAEAYEYFKKAYHEDPSFNDAGFAYGSQRLLIRTDTLQSRNELYNSLEMLRKYVDSNPEDIFAGRFYGYVTTRLDTIEESVRVLERMTDLMPAESYLLLNLAETYMMQNKPDKAVETLSRYEKMEGKSQEVSLKKMTFLLAGGDTVSALEEASLLIETNPRNPNYLILKGNLYDVIGDSDSTLSYYKRAEEISPDNGAVKISLANYYMQMGDSISYDAKMYEALLSEDFELQDKLGILSDYLQTLINDKGETSRGDYLFEVLMEQYPHEAEVLDLSARYNGAKGDFKAAQEQISYAIDQDPTNENYWGQLMRYQLADSASVKAIETYKNAREHIEVPEGLTLMYAAALAETKDYEGAEEAYASLIRSLNPDLPLTDSITDTKFRSKLSYEDLIRLSTLYNMLGDLYYQQKNIDNAFRAYENSLFFYASNALTLNNYAYFLAETGGDLDKAQEMSKRAIHEMEDNPTYLDTYAWILFKKKEYKEALDYQLLALEKAEEIGDINSEYFHHLGDILFMNHEPEKALENWMRALELEPDNSLLKKKVEYKTFFYE